MRCDASGSIPRTRRQGTRFIGGATIKYQQRSAQSGPGPAGAGGLPGREAERTYFTFGMRTMLPLACGSFGSLTTVT